MSDFKNCIPRHPKVFQAHFFDHVVSVEAGGLEIFRETRFLRQQCRFQADNDPSAGYLTIPCFIVSRNQEHEGGTTGGNVCQKI